MSLTFDARELAERAAAARRRNPHPLHRALAAYLSRLGVGFLCEKRIANYYADFCFPDSGLLVELDGSCHDSARDQKRDSYLRRSNWEIMRFPHTVPIAQITSEILAWIGANGLLCHACRRNLKTGKRYCRPCSIEQQELFRTKQLGLPPRRPAQPEKCTLHPHSGLTEWGTCWGCYSQAARSGRSA